MYTLNELQRLELPSVFLCDCNRDESIRARVDMYIRKLKKSALAKTLNAIDRFVATHYSFALPQRERSNGRARIKQHEWAQFVFSKQIKYELWLRISIGFFLCHLSSFCAALSARRCVRACLSVCICVFENAIFETNSGTTHWAARLYIGERCKSSLVPRKIVYALTKLMLSSLSLFIFVSFRRRWLRTRSDMWKHCARGRASEQETRWNRVLATIAQSSCLSSILHAGYKNARHIKPTLSRSLARVLSKRAQEEAKEDAKCKGRTT